ncbi:MAG: hypothetical protein LBJ64_05345, partial [Deltaproteobacteria bacterium]|nr:hypothetical protein [Deltaproteobacteria bacterium]
EKKTAEGQSVEGKTVEGKTVEGKTVEGKISKEKTSKENIAEARKGENGGVGNMTLAIKSSVLGRFNALNILGAAAAAAALGLEPRTIEKALSGFAGTPGRLTRVGENSDYLVLADYSHTPEALKVALETLDGLKEDPESRLLCLFGCGGDRDRGKRPLMGRTAARLADVVILTSDNPRTEDPMAIIEEAGQGLKDSGLKPVGAADRTAGRKSRTFVVEEDRRLAVRYGCEVMNKGDIFLIAGKGHENYQILGREKRHFDDVEEALAVLRELGRE